MRSNPKGGKFVERERERVWHRLLNRGDLRLREIRGNVEKQLANRCQILRSPHLRLWSCDVYGRLRVSDGTRKPRETKQNIANTRDVRTAIVRYESIRRPMLRIMRTTLRYHIDHCRDNKLYGHHTINSCNEI